MQDQTKKAITPPDITPHVGGRCGDCHHRWIVAYLPMPIHKFAALASAARCPKCGSGRVFVATDPE